MINILCYGDSNTWGQIPGSMNIEKMLAERFDRDLRWTGLLQEILGVNYYVIEAGLNGRNTSFDETKLVRPSRNGLVTLPLILEMNYPLDLVILMLGTNDTKKDFDSTLEQTITAMRKMIRYIQESHLGQSFGAPKVLLVAPASIHKIDSDDFAFFYDDSSIAKTQHLAKHYSKLAEEEHCYFLDAGKIVKISNKDGVHIEGDSQRAFAIAVAQLIQERIEKED